MKRLLILVCTVLFSRSVYAETINLTCYSDLGGKKFASNFTIIAPTSRTKGKVYVDDKDLDSRTQSSIQEVTNVQVTPSTISYEVHYKTAPEFANGKQYSAGSVDIFRNISRVSGLSIQTTNTYGGMIGEAVGEGGKYSEDQCEPRRANKF